MKTKLVTAFYTDVGNHPFYGHIEVSRHDRYLHSLRAISNTKQEIVCYCNETQYDFLKKYCEDLNLKNVLIKISNLVDYPNVSKMIEIKEKTNAYNFYHEIGIQHASSPLDIAWYVQETIIICISWIGLIHVFLSNRTNPL